MDRAILNPDVPGTGATSEGPVHLHFGFACHLPISPAGSARNAHSLVGSHTPPPSILRLSLPVPREEPSGEGGTRVADGEEIVGQESPMKNDQAERGQLRKFP